jgi:hypothetical protein
MYHGRLAEGAAARDVEGVMRGIALVHGLALGSENSAKPWLSRKHGNTCQIAPLT